MGAVKGKEMENERGKEGGRNEKRTIILMKIVNKKVDTNKR